MNQPWETVRCSVGDRPRRRIVGRPHFVAASLGLALALGASFAPARAGSWERVKEFYGTVTIQYEIDHEVVMDGQKHIRRKNASATVHVTGYTFDGAYSWPVGTITGTMSAETQIGAYSGSFSGSIDDRFDGQKHGGPGLEVNKELGLYQISLPHLYAMGTATATVPGLGTSTDPAANDDAAPILPERYRSGGVPYDPEAGSIDGGFTHWQDVPSVAKPIRVTMTANWHFDFERPPLWAEAGESQTVERGETVTLDGSGSTGEIEGYRWTLEADDCPPGTDLSHVEREGERVEFVVLCSLTATLTVTDGVDTDSDQVSVRVIPREWHTAFSEDTEEIAMGNAGPPLVNPSGQSTFPGGENVCAHGQSPQDYHNFHPRATNDSWEGGGYTLELIRDTGGPFDGYWYLSEYKLEIRRAIALNPYLHDGDLAISLPNSETTFYRKNKAASMDVDGYLEAVRTHERLHSSLKKDALDSDDPAEDVEDEFSWDRGALTDRVDAKIRAVEREICERSSDPLPDRSKWFDLLFPVGGGNFLKAQTCVGGACERKIPCP